MNCGWIDRRDFPSRPLFVRRTDDGSTTVSAACASSGPYPWTTPTGTAPCGTTTSIRSRSSPVTIATPPPGRPWVLANMIASADGSATDPDGRSGGLAGAGRPGDVRRPARRRRRHRGRRRHRHRPRTTAPADRSTASASCGSRGARPRRPGSPSTSASLAIEPTRRLFAEATPDARPIVLTVAAADPAPRTALAEVADVHVVGDDQVDWARAFALLHDELGARVVVCEGGPLDARPARGRRPARRALPDDRRPLLAGARPAHRPRPGRRCTAAHYSLARVVVDDDDLFLRYVARPAEADAGRSVALGRGALRRAA